MTEGLNSAEQANDDRQNKQNSLRILGNIKRLLVNGLFPGGQSVHVLESLNYVDGISQLVASDLASDSGAGLKLPNQDIVAADGATTLLRKP